MALKSFLKIFPVVMSTRNVATNFLMELFYLKEDKANVLVVLRTGTACWYCLLVLPPILTFNKQSKLIVG
jgi:hypothetical protein